MNGQPLFEVLNKLIAQHPNTTFLIDGDSLRGEFKRLIDTNPGKYIFVRDYMGTGIGAPEILSAEHIAHRIKEFCYPWNDSVTYTSDNYEQECATELRTLSEKKDTEIVLVQFDCHISSVFQLTMQAYCEQLGITDHIIRVVFCEKSDSVRTEFICCKYDTIPIAGSHQAYCKLVCEHRYVQLSKYLISSTAVKSYLDVHSPTGKLAEYIRNTSSSFDNPFSAVGMFLRDFWRLGLGDLEFLKIAYSTLVDDPKYYKVAKKWEQKLIEIFK